MNLIDIKKNIEQFFSDNYSLTTVHWAGMNFDTTVYPEWVYFEYVGSSVLDSGLDNSSYAHKGYINITVVAITPFKVNEIASSVISLFKAKNIQGSIPRRVSVIEQGYDTDINKSYIVLNIDVDSQ